jgi:hypothetical protein
MVLSIIIYIPEFIMAQIIFDKKMKKGLTVPKIFLW